jgi:hypothetical protein
MCCAMVPTWDIFFIAQIFSDQDSRSIYVSRVFCKVRMYGVSSSQLFLIFFSIHGATMAIDVSCSWMKNLMYLTDQSFHLTVLSSILSST